MNTYRTSTANGFKSWSLAQQRRGDDEKPPDAATPIALAVPDDPLPTPAKSAGTKR